MNRRYYLGLILLFIIAVNFSVTAATPNQFLRSRLTTLTARLYQTISQDIEPDQDYTYSIGLFPLIDVNSEKPMLIQYLQQRMEEVIVNFPTINLIDTSEVVKMRDELKSENLSQEELFIEIGKRLNISGLIITSLVSHPDYYVINGLVANTKTGSHRKVELVILDKATIDSLPMGIIESIEIPEPISEKTQANTETVDDQVKTDAKSTDAQKTDLPITTADKDSTSQPSPQKETNDQTTDISHSEQTSDTKLVKDTTIRLNSRGQSWLFHTPLLGFAIGDFNDDQIDELVFNDGANLQVRSLVDYQLLWFMENYEPLSNDHKLLTVDIDRDGKDEIIGHGRLSELVADRLISTQPRFISRPVSFFDKKSIALFNNGVIYIVNYKGLIIEKYILGEEYGKRFIFIDLDKDGVKELVATMEGEDERATVKVFKVEDELNEMVTFDGEYGYAVHSMDLNQNDIPEIYLRRNFFDGEKFLYSKIFVYEFLDGKMNLLTETPRLDYYIVDFASYPQQDPTRLVVGGMYLKHKKQSLKEITSSLFFYTLD